MTKRTRKPNGNRSEVIVDLSRSDAKLLIDALDAYKREVSAAGGRPSAVAMAASEAELLKQRINESIEIANTVDNAAGW